MREWLQNGCHIQLQNKVSLARVIKKFADVGSIAMAQWLYKGPVWFGWLMVVLKLPSWNQCSINKGTPPINTVEA